MSGPVDTTVAQVFGQPDQAWLVSAALDEALKGYTGLQCAARTYIQNSGEELLLLCIAGTIPVELHRDPGRTYFIPIDLWLLPDFPASSPMVYVVPTPSMMLSPSDVVGVDGRVVLQPPNFYWNHYASNGASSLLRLLDDISQAFSNHCPVVAKPPPSQSAPSEEVQQQQQQQPSHLLPRQQQQHPHQQQQQHPHQQQGGPRQPPAADRPGSREQEERHEERQRLMRDVEAKVRSRMISLQNGASALATLRQQNISLQQSAAALAEYEKLASGQLKEMETEMAELGLEQSEHEQKLRDFKLNHPKPDDLVTAPAELYDQMLDLISEDRAIEDLLYSLFVAFRESRMDLASYMTKLRSLTREQFEIKTRLTHARDIVARLYE